MWQGQGRCGFRVKREEGLESSCVSCQGALPEETKPTPCCGHWMAPYFSCVSPGIAGRIQDVPGGLAQFLPIAECLLRALPSLAPHPALLEVASFAFLPTCQAVTCLRAFGFHVYLIWNLMPPGMPLAHRLTCSGATPLRALPRTLPYRELPLEARMEPAGQGLNSAPPLAAC